MIISAEIVNGAAREALLVPMLGRTAAGRLSFAVALVLIMSIAVVLVGWIRAAGLDQLLLTGAIWVLLTFGFEAAIGIVVLGLSWEQVLADYDIRRGGLMLFGLIFMLFAPAAAFELRSAFSRGGILGQQFGKRREQRLGRIWFC